MPQIYNLMLQFFLELKSSYETDLGQDLVLFHNKEILIDQKTLFYKWWLKVLLRSNYRCSFFYISVYNMTFLHILPNFSPLRTSEVILFLLLFPRIYGRHYLTLFQGLVAN